MNAGDIQLGATLDLKFTTIDSTGVGSALTDGVVVAYPDNSDTEITAGITLTAGFDGRTGLNNVRVEATSGNGFEAGKNYTLVMTAGTVDGASLEGYVLAHFSIQNRYTSVDAVNDVAVTGAGTEADPWRAEGS